VSAMAFSVKQSRRIRASRADFNQDNQKSVGTDVFNHESHETHEKIGFRVISCLSWLTLRFRCAGICPVSQVSRHILLGLVMLAAVPSIHAGEYVTSDKAVQSLNTAENQDKSTKREENPELDGWRLFFQAMGSLALVLGLIGALAFVLKRYAKSAQLTSDRTDTIRIVGTKMLGGRRCLMLVRVRGQTLLLGVTSQSIHCLTEIHELENEWVQPSSTEGTGAPGVFERQLGKFVNETIASEKSVSRQS